MMKKPEEFIVAVLGALWVVLTWVVAAYFGIPAQTALLITVLTLLWTIVVYLLWARALLGWVWPIFLGLLVACWWPALDWLAIRDVLTPDAQTGTIILNKPWYATWTFKFILALVPVALGYGAAFMAVRKRKQARLNAPIKMS